MVRTGWTKAADNHDCRAFGSIVFLRYDPALAGDLWLRKARNAIAKWDASAPPQITLESPDALTMTALGRRHGRDLTFNLTGHP